MGNLTEKTRTWLKDSAFRLWSERGVDWECGGFFENLSSDGHGRPSDTKRTMVQARQIFCFWTAGRRNHLAPGQASRILKQGAQFFEKNAFLPSGAVVHSLHRTGATDDPTPGLYAQAFGLFGMAYAYQDDPQPRYRERALGILKYLDTQRRVKSGGFSETSKDGPLYHSNPLMHLFEGILTWLEIDPKGPWQSIAEELADFCRTHLIDAQTGLLAEHFDSSWQPLRPEGRFLYEPGHQYEWAWLLKRYETLTGQALPQDPATRLFQNAEQWGLNSSREAFDEGWSDRTPKRLSARFWPQCERIKAALIFNKPAAADEALLALWPYLETKVPGLWHDLHSEDGKWTGTPVKASSLYHIVGAMDEYLTHR